MVNNCRKLVQKGFLFPKMLDKLYYPMTETEVPANKEQRTEFNETSLLINKSLSENSDGSILIVNSGNEDMNEVYLGNLETNNIDYIDLNDTLNVLQSQGIDINYWTATKKYGHWNHEAHKAVGNFIANKLTCEFKLSNSSNSKNLQN